jgi:hypothetical protein
MQLRCLLENNFETDTVVKENLRLFEEQWIDLHGVTDFNATWNKRKYDSKCFGVQVMSGVNDFKYDKIKD